MARLLKLLAVPLALAIVTAALLAAYKLGVQSRSEQAQTITGDLTFTSPTNLDATKTGCVGTGGYSDLADGAAVIVKNERGEIIGTGSLGPGRLQGEKFSRLCIFPFTISDVKDAKFFQVEVSHRGGLTYSKADLKAASWTVHSTIG